MGKIHKSPEYACWVTIRQKCNNPNHPRYKDYGGRGITVSKEWDKFKDFLSDVGLRPSKKHSIERIDNEKGYSSSNCKWATAEEQANNKRSSVIVTYKGETKTLMQHCRDRKTYITIVGRVFRGWDIERALSEPIQGFRTGWPKGVKRKT